MEIIKLNLIPSGALPVVHASQYDDGRVFRADLFDGAEVYTLDGTEVLECDIKKPDGNVVTVAITNTSDSYVEITTTLQMCACSGESLGEINIKKDGDSIGTLNFILAVERSPLENGIQSDSAIHNLEQQIADAVADQYDADSVIFDSVPTAGHGIGYAVTSEGVLNSIPEELDDLSDVTTTAPTSGEALVWDGSKWTNGTVSTVGSIDDLNDVDTSGKTAGDSLRFDPDAGEEGEWVAEPITIKMTTAEWEDIADKQAWRNAHKNTYLIITDAPNLNETAKQISYDGSTDTVWDKVEERTKPSDFVTQSFSNTFSVNANTDVAANLTITKAGYTPLGVVFYTIANKDCLPHAIIFTDTDTVTFHITNISATAKSNISITATVLFVKA